MDRKTQETTERIYKWIFEVKKARKDQLSNSGAIFERGSQKMKKKN